MSGVREPAVAGLFYPAAPEELRTTIEGYLAAAASTGSSPKALIAPHAGYVYSGPVAAAAYASLADARSAALPISQPPIQPSTSPTSNARPIWPTARSKLRCRM